MPLFSVLKNVNILIFQLSFHLPPYPSVDSGSQKNLATPMSRYVDDYDSSKNSVPDAFEQYLKLKQRFREGGFSMKKWASRSAELSEMTEKVEEDLILTGTDPNLD